MFRLVSISVACILSTVLFVATTQAVEYRVDFNGEWSAATHPSAYPGTSAHFSPLIGGTHDGSVSFWEPGQLASPGIESMAEVGGTTTLRSEIETARDPNAVISGNGINSPGSTSITFDINASHPLVTLVAMVAPSPDWFVGVHGLNLRNDGQWIPSVSVDLFAYDAGTENGSGFSLSNPPTVPPVPIALLGAPFVGDSTSRLGTFTFNLVPDPSCDFDGDLACGLADINLMMAQGNLVTEVSVHPGNPFDLNSDNIINEADITEWLGQAGTQNGFSSPFLRGDTDGLDQVDPNPRTVDVTDFNNFLNGFTGLCVDWECGNFNGDNHVDITDFSNHFMSSFSLTAGGTYGPAQSIPEPSAVLLLLVGAMLLVWGATSGSGPRLFSM